MSCRRSSRERTGSQRHQRRYLGSDRGQHGRESEFSPVPGVGDGARTQKVVEVLESGAGQRSIPEEKAGVRTE